jgi:hypothetical protein
MKEIYLSYAKETYNLKNSRRVHTQHRKEAQLKKIIQNIAGILENTFEKVYNAVCIDIDNTTISETMSETDNISQGIINTFKKLFDANVCVCFVTDRGLKNAIECGNKLLRVFQKGLHTRFQISSREPLT